MQLEEVIEKAAGELPAGACISISIERESGFVEAMNRDDECWDADTADMTLSDQVLAALDWCKQTTNEATQPQETAAVC